MDVVAVMEELGRTQQGLVTSAQLVAAGVSRPALSRAKATGDVVRIRRAVYALTPLPARPRHLVIDKGVATQYVMHVRAVLLSVGGSVAACGRTAAALYGWGLLVEPTGTVEVAVPHGWGSARRRGIRTTQRRSAARSRVRVLAGTARLRMTTPVQTVLDCAVALPLLQSVLICDSALRSGQVNVEQLIRAAARLPGVSGADRARQMIALCDPRSGSVLESVLRVHLLQAGITGFITQAVIAPSLRVDSCFRDVGLVVEVDGARWHQDPARDQARDNTLAVLGWRVLRLTWADVVHDSQRVVADVLAALTATPTLHPLGGEHEQAA